MPHLLTGLMHDGLRLDVAVVARSALAARPRRPLIALHDPDGILVGIEFTSPRFEPTPEWLRRHVNDFLRFLDQLNVVVVRREWIDGGRQRLVPHLEVARSLRPQQPCTAHLTV